MSTKQRQAAPAQRRPLLHRIGVSSLRDSNIQKKEKGIAAAEANASRPKRILGSESFVDRYSEMDPIHPMMATIEKANRRLTRVCGSRATTTRPRLKSTAQSVRVPSD